MKSMFVRFVREDAGQDLIEYAILIGLITVLVIASITSIGTTVQQKFSSLDSAFN